MDFIAGAGAFRYGCRMDRNLNITPTLKVAKTVSEMPRKDSDELSVFCGAL